MQFAVSNATDLPPVWVQGRYTDAGGLDGISTTGIMHHRKVRRPALWFVFDQAIPNEGSRKVAS
jgi:hypothetical protein